MTSDTASFSPSLADHNQYIHKGYSWQSNYCAGLRVLDASNLASGQTSEVGYFDVSPECNTAVFSGKGGCRCSVL